MIIFRQKKGTQRNQTNSDYKEKTESEKEKIEWNPLIHKSIYVVQSTDEWIVTDSRWYLISVFSFYFPCCLFIFLRVFFAFEIVLN